MEGPFARQVGSLRSSTAAESRTAARVRAVRLSLLTRLRGPLTREAQLLRVATVALALLATLPRGVVALDLGSAVASNTGANEGVGPNDSISITFSEPTNTALMLELELQSSATVDSLFRFERSGARVSLGANYSGMWLNNTAFRIDLHNTSGANVSVGDSVTCVSGLVRSLLAVLVSSTPVSLTGDFGAIAPSVLLSANASDDGANAGLGINDAVTLTFSRATNRGGFGAALLSKTQVDSMVRFTIVGQSASLGLGYSGQWTSESTLRITVLDPTGANVSVGNTSVNVVPSTVFGLADSLAVASTPVLLSGSFGAALASVFIVSAVASDVADAPGLNAGDRVTITFNVDTNRGRSGGEPTKQQIDQMLVFENFGNNVSLGANYTGQWSGSDRVLTITVHNVTGATLVIGTSTVRALPAIKSKDESENVSLASILLTGSFEPLARVRIVSAVAADTGEAAGLSAGDSLTLVFSMDTNKGGFTNSLTRTQVDQLFVFDVGGVPATLGALYTGFWTNLSSCVLTIVDATGANATVPGASVRVHGSLLLSADLATPASLSPQLISGSWGLALPVGPAIVSAFVDDPFDWEGVTVGDRVAISFDSSTNRPGGSVTLLKAVVDTMFVFEMSGRPVSLGANYTGSWTSNFTFAIEVVDPRGANATATNVTVRVLGTSGISNLAGTANASAVSHPLSGSFGSTPAPSLTSAVAFDPLNVAGVTPGDYIVITFSMPTDRAGLNTTNVTKAVVDGLFVFESLAPPGNLSLGTQYHGSWSSDSEFVIYLDDPAGANLSVGSTFVRLRGSAVRHITGRIAVSGEEISLTGTFGSLAPVVPRLVLAVLQDEDLSGTLSSGDGIYLTFSTPTNQAGLGSSIVNASTVKALFVFETDAFGEQAMTVSLGLNFEGDWHSSVEFHIHLLDVRGANVTVGSTRVRVAPNALVRDLTGTLAPDNQSVVLSGLVPSFSDPAPPVVVSVSLASSDVVDLRGGDALVLIDIAAYDVCTKDLQTDGASGMYFGQNIASKTVPPSLPPAPSVEVVTPTGARHKVGLTPIVTGNAGTCTYASLRWAYNGTLGLRLMLHLPQRSPGGTWRLGMLELSDLVGNVQRVDAALSFVVVPSQAPQQDTQGPQLVAFEIGPSLLPATNASLTLSAVFAEPVGASGVPWGAFVPECRPSQRFVVEIACDSSVITVELDPRSATAANATHVMFNATTPLPEAEDVVWFVRRVSAYDRVLNALELNTTDLARAFGSRIVARTAMATEPRLLAVGLAPPPQFPRDTPEVALELGGGSASLTAQGVFYHPLGFFVGANVSFVPTCVSACHLNFSAAAETFAFSSANLFSSATISVCSATRTFAARLGGANLRYAIDSVGLAASNTTFVLSGFDDEFFDIHGLWPRRHGANAKPRFLVFSSLPVAWDVSFAGGILAVSNSSNSSVRIDAKFAFDAAVAPGVVATVQIATPDGSLFPVALSTAVSASVGTNVSASGILTLFPGARSGRWRIVSLRMHPPAGDGDGIEWSDMHSDEGRLVSALPPVGVGKDLLVASAIEDLHRPVIQSVTMVSGAHLVLGVEEFVLQFTFNDPCVGFCDVPKGVAEIRHVASGLVHVLPFSSETLVASSKMRVSRLFRVPRPPASPPPTGTWQVVRIIADDAAGNRGVLAHLHLSFSLEEGDVTSGCVDDCASNGDCVLFNGEPRCTCYDDPLLNLLYDSACRTGGATSSGSESGSTTGGDGSFSSTSSGGNFTESASASATASDSSTAGPSASDSGTASPTESASGGDSSSGTGTGTGPADPYLTCVDPYYAARGACFAELSIELVAAELPATNLGTRFAAACSNTSCLSGVTQAYRNSARCVQNSLGGSGLSRLILSQSELGFLCSARSQLAGDHCASWLASLGSFSSVSCLALRAGACCTHSAALFAKRAVLFPSTERASEYLAALGRCGVAPNASLACPMPSFAATPLPEPQQRACDVEESAAVLELERCMPLLDETTMSDERWRNLCSADNCAASAAAALRVAERCLANVSNDSGALTRLQTTRLRIEFISQFCTEARNWVSASRRFCPQFSRMWLQESPSCLDLIAAGCCMHSSLYAAQLLGPAALASALSSAMLRCGQIFMPPQLCPRPGWAAVYAVNSSMRSPAPTLQRIEVTSAGTGLQVVFNADVLLLANGSAAASLCAATFSAATLARLGQGHSCFWFSQRVLVVQFGFDAQVALNEQIRLLDGVFRSADNTSDSATGLAAPLQAPPTLPPMSVFLSVPLLIGPCTPILVTVTSQGTGIRIQRRVWQFTVADAGSASAAEIEAARAVNVFLALQNETLSSVLIPVSLFNGTGGNFTLSVNVTNWLGVSASASQRVTRAANPVPVLTVRGGNQQRFVMGQAVVVTVDVAQPDVCVSNGSNATSNLASLVFAWDFVPHALLTDEQRLALGLATPSSADLPWWSAAPDALSSQRSRVLSLSGSALPFGQGFLRLRVFNAAAGAQGSALNQVIVLVRVSAPLAAFLEGGNREVDSRDTRPVRLDARRSSDPAGRPLLYSWSCVRAAVSVSDSAANTSVQGAACFNASVAAVLLPRNSTSSFIEVPSSLLGSGEVRFLFTVNVSTDDGRWAASSASLIGVPRAVTRVFIQPLASAIASSSVPLVPSDKRLVLRGFGDWVTSTRVVRAGFSALWRDLDPTARPLSSVPQLLATRPNVSDLVLLPEYFVPGRRYSFALDVVDPTGVQSSAFVEFVTVSRPQVGTCGPAPGSEDPSDYSMERTFSIVCSAFGDAPEVLPLTFTFAATFGGAEQALGPPQTSPTYTGKLPAPRGSNRTLALRVTAENRAGGRSSLDFAVVVGLFPNASANTEWRQVARGLVADDSDLSRAAKSGDAESVLATAVTVMSVLNEASRTNAVRGDAAALADLRATRAECMRQLLVFESAVANASDNDTAATLAAARAKLAVLDMLMAEAEQVDSTTRSAGLSLARSSVQRAASVVAASGAIGEDDGDSAGASYAVQSVTGLAAPALSVASNGLRSLRGELNATSEGDAQSEARQFANSFKDLVSDVGDLLRASLMPGEQPLALSSESVAVQVQRSLRDQVSGELVVQADSNGSILDAAGFALEWQTLVNRTNSSVIDYVLAVAPEDVYAWASQGNDSATVADLRSRSRPNAPGQGLSASIVTLAFRDASGREISVRDLPPGSEVSVFVPYALGSGAAGRQVLLASDTAGDADVVLGDPSGEKLYQLALCRYFDEVLQIWRSDGLVVGPRTTLSTVQCTTTHLTSFSTEFRSFEPEVRRLGDDDFRNLTWGNLMEHPTTLIAVLTVLLVYVVLLPWARFIDKRNEAHYAYLVEGVQVKLTGDKKRPSVELVTAGTRRRMDSDAREVSGHGDAPPSDAPSQPSGAGATAITSGELERRELVVHRAQLMSSSLANIDTEAADMDPDADADVEANGGSRRNTINDERLNRAYDRVFGSSRVLSRDASRQRELDLMRDPVAQRAQRLDADAESSPESSHADQAAAPHGRLVAAALGANGRASSGDGDEDDALARLESAGGSVSAHDLDLIARSRDRQRAPTKVRRMSTQRWRQSELASTFVTQFRHRHLWLSVLLRHPRDRVNSVERISIVLALLLGTMAINAAFYGATQRSVAADIVVVLISSLAALPSTTLLLVLFRGGSCSSRVLSKSEVMRKLLKLPSVPGSSDSGCCPHQGKRLAWAFWTLWCLGCALLSLVYGLQFDLREAEASHESSGRFDFVAMGVSRRSLKWLVACVFAVLQDILLNRPLLVGVRSVLATKCGLRFLV